MVDLPAVKRRGWTLHEMLVSLGVTGAVIGLVAHTALGQLRFFGEVDDVAALRGQTTHASAIAANALWGVSSGGGDIVAALDSAIEFQLPTGTAVVCASVPGRVTVPAPAGPSGNTLSAFAESPDSADRVMALFADSLGATWLTLQTAAPPGAGDACIGFQGSSGTWSIPLREALLVPIGTPLRFARPFRLSVYRASDGRWYLGAKSWNAATQRFNTIQPVAGPLRPYDADPSRTGLLFVYRDANGDVLSTPVESTRIASVTVVSRAQSGRPSRGGVAAGAQPGPYEDSTVTTIALRNAR